MAIVNLITIKNWFKTGLKPTQQQFWDTWDSFWHKEDMIPIEKIQGIQAIYNAVNNHIADQNAHAALFAKTKIYALGELQIFKRTGTNLTALEVNDFVKGIIQGIYIEAIYLGNDESLLTSYDIINQIEFENPPVLINSEIII
ncbi:MAG: hypothetical protein ABI549_13380, partial [Flavobacterium sp.]